MTIELIETYLATGFFDAIIVRFVNLPMYQGPYNPHPWHGSSHFDDIPHVISIIEYFKNKLPIILSPLWQTPPDWNAWEADACPCDEDFYRIKYGHLRNYADGESVKNMWDFESWGSYGWYEKAPDFCGNHSCNLCRGKDRYEESLRLHQKHGGDLNWGATPYGGWPLIYTCGRHWMCQYTYYQGTPYHSHTGITTYPGVMLDHHHPSNRIAKIQTVLDMYDDAVVIYSEEAGTSFEIRSQEPSRGCTDDAPYKHLPIDENFFAKLEAIGGGTYKPGQIKPPEEDDMDTEELKKAYKKHPQEVRAHTEELKRFIDQVENQATAELCQQARERLHQIPEHMKVWDTMIDHHVGADSDPR